MAGQVRRSDGSIGYVELIYALQNDMKYGAVQNREQEFVQASLESVTRAADNSLKTIPDDPGRDRPPGASAR